MAELGSEAALPDPPPQGRAGRVRAALSPYLSALRPSFYRQTPIRLTLIFILVYSLVASAIFAYVYMATAAETRAVSDAAVKARLEVLKQAFYERGVGGVRDKLAQDDLTEWFFIKGMFEDDANVITLNKRAALELKPHTLGAIHDIARQAQVNGPPTVLIINRHETEPNGVGIDYRYRGKALALEPGVTLFVGMDTSWADSGFSRGLTALWGGAALVVLFGMVAGLLINAEVARSTGRLTQTLDKVQSGDLKARVPVNFSGDEFDQLGTRINQTLDQMEQSMGNLKYAGDAIAHDLRTPLSRLRSKLELSLIEVGNDPRVVEDVLGRALEETDQLLKTFQTVFAISRLQAQGNAPDQTVFDPAGLCRDMAEFYEPAAVDKGLEFDLELTEGLKIMGNADFLAQAMANLLDNAIKYTGHGGVSLRLRRTQSGAVEISVTDTGPGVEAAERERIAERFVRLENSRNQPGAGLGLAMVAAIAVAHGGRLSIEEGPGRFDNQGPGLRTALVLPAIQS